MIKVIITFLLIFTVCSAHAFEVNRVHVNCDSKASCIELENAFKSLSRKYENIQHFKSIIKIYIANNGIKSFSYNLKKHEGLNNLYISVTQRERINYVDDPNFIGANSIELPSILPIKINDYYDIKKNQSTVELIKDIAKERGYPNAEVHLKTVKSDSGISLFTSIKLGKAILVNDIILVTKSNYIKKILIKRFGHFKKSPFDLQAIKFEIEKSKKLLTQYGYYLADFSVKVKRPEKNKTLVYIEIKEIKNYIFHFQDKLFFDVEELKQFMSNAFLGFRRELDVSAAREVVKEKYETLGFMNTKITVKKKMIKDPNNEAAILYEFSISENMRTRISQILVQGNNHFSSEDLIESFYSTATSQASQNYFDQKYYEQFVEYAREKYIAAGFVNIFIDKPVVRITGDDTSILFRIKEGLRTNINRLDITGIAVSEKYEILELIQNKSKRHFDPIAFRFDLQNITKFLQSRGYYFASITNIQDKDLVKYAADSSEVDIKIDIDSGLKLYTNQIIIIGNVKTRKLLIKREVSIKSGDLLTNQKIEDSKTNLLGLGLFSSVQIKPVSDATSKTDVLIFVREKDFGLIELAPGVRSDLGFKMSAAINYNNIDGMNKRISFKGTVNKRFELGSLDSRRQEESSSLVEYKTIANFAEDHIFHSDLDFTASLSKSRKRFYAFDADIQRLSLGITEDFTSWFSMGLRYQLEVISQFDATDDDHHGHYKIGSLTPSMSLDFRDRAINTSKGALFNFSCEFANPEFGSQENTEINYYKLVNRNKFYIPISNKGVFAISTAYGIQENKSNEVVSGDGLGGKIPGIKVFRLTGPDIVRGYEDGEINRLITGEDISDINVTNRAYMINLKLEPRFYLSDTSMIGIFYDAGRVFVDEFDTSELRSSVGLSFKYLTPVGSLDFDYGIKLLREEDNDGRLDSPGRLHVSIGFF
jgi:outer membrane protein insertion porin family